MNALETLIGQFQERPLPDLTTRDIVLPEVPNTASVLVGMRRSGKTYLLFQEMKRLVESGVDKRRMLYLNLEDDRLGRPTLETLSEALETFYRHEPQAREAGAFLFFDEIQVVDGWSRFARRVLDTEEARLFVSGSSAKLLSTEVATEFRGRGAAVEVLPFSFQESARHVGIAFGDEPVGPRRRSLLEAHLDRYLEVGGFPAVQGLEYPERVRTLQDYVELVVVRDVIERHGGASPSSARWFALSLLRQTGSLFSVNKTYQSMRSLGIEVGKNTLHALLDHLTDAYLVSPVSAFRVSHSERVRLPRKIYAIDPGLALAVSVAAAENVGARLETAVYVELRRRLGRLRDGAISYYVTQSGHEVDFVIGDVEAGTSRELVQVCAEPGSEATLLRETRALGEAMSELGLGSATMVSLRAEDSIGIGPGTVEIVPAWKWFAGIT
ncbi:MAG: ATP-binding protein [Actinomycetota bacterium]|nr:ATP-binding protein [Actinomycetota bacterium]